MIAIYQDFEKDLRQSAVTVNPGGTQGFLIKPRDDQQFVIELITVSLAAPNTPATNTIYNAQLCVVDAAGTPIGAPNINPLWPMWKVWPNNAGANTGQTLNRVYPNLEIEVGRGAGVGWFVQTATDTTVAPNQVYAAPGFMSILVAGRWKPYGYQATPVSDNLRFQPAGSGF